VELIKFTIGLLNSEETSAREGRWNGL